MTLGNLIFRAFPTILAVLVLTSVVACAAEPLPPPPGLAGSLSALAPPSAQELPPPPPDIRDDPACKLFEWPMSVSRASEILRHTLTFANTGIYSGGEPSPQVAAFNVLFDQPDATLWFDEIARGGGAVGRLYALCAFQLLDARKAADLALELLGSEERVDTQFGCTGGDHDVPELVGDIQKYEYGQGFRDARERTFEYYGREVNLCTQPKRRDAPLGRPAG